LRQDLGKIAIVGQPDHWVHKKLAPGQGEIGSETEDFPAPVFYPANRHREQCITGAVSCQLSAFSYQLSAISYRLEATGLRLLAFGLMAESG
jgi:hypothetical protein